MICKKCGQALGDDTNRCPICKTEQYESGMIDKIEQVENIMHSDEYKITYTPRSRMVAGLLQLFLGGFGLGRFYLGYSGIGFAQLFTMPIFFIGCIWGFIDGILILCGQVPYDVNGVPLK